MKVADFFRRTVGSEVLDYVVDPFISTVYCGDPSKMSLRYGLVMKGVEFEVRSSGLEVGGEVAACHA